MTSYGDKWLGYAEFEPIWAELNRRKATVYTHPISPDCCTNLVRGIDNSVIEFGVDTTRALFTVVFGGVAEKYPDINWIWSHGGGALTAIADRIQSRALHLQPYAGKITREQVSGQLRRFYYDTAMVMDESTLAAMVRLMPMSQIVYGTDYPYRSSEDYTKGLPAFFRGEDLKAIERDNALRLIPRLRNP